MLSVKAGDYLWMVEFRFGVPYPETIRKMVVTHTDADTNHFECIPTSGTANRLYEFDANGIEKTLRLVMNSICWFSRTRIPSTIFATPSDAQKHYIWLRKTILTTLLSKPLTLPLRFSA